MSFETLHAAVNQLRKMSYMHTDKTAEPHDPVEESDLSFTKTRRVEGTNEEKLQIIVENAEKIPRALRSGPISSDEQVAESMRPIYEPQSREAAYHYYVGPLTATLKGVEWHTSYQIDLSEAVEPKGEAFREVASDFDIPDSNTRELVPEFIEEAYAYLINRTEYNNGERYIHPWELKHTSNTPHLVSQNYDYALRYVNRLPGVQEPDTDGPAWKLVEETSVSDTHEQDSKSQNAETTG